MVWCRWHKCVHRVRCRRSLTGREHGFRGVRVRLSCREHGTRRLVRAVRRREVQDEPRELGVHGLWYSDVLGCGRCECFLDVLDVSYECEFASLESDEWFLHL